MPASQTARTAQKMWTEKYFPKEWSEFIGNSEAVSQARKWADSWQKGKKLKPLLLYGSPGNGKTTLALLLAQKMGWTVFELNASDFRTKEIIERLAGSASQSASFTGKPRLVLLDEVDGLQRQDRGGASAILKLLKETQHPVILTANEIYGIQKLTPVVHYCEKIHFKKINYLSIAKRLREICELEGIHFNEEAIKELAQNSGGDMRAALLDLQTLAAKGSISRPDLNALGYREREENIFKVLRDIFRAKSFEEARNARFKSEADDELLMRWIEENIPREFSTEDQARAFDYYSRGDKFEGRIFKRQHYGFRRYSYELMSTCTALSRHSVSHSWVQYQFPSLLKKLSKSRAVREIKNSLSKKVGRKMHSSARGVMQHELPLLFLLFGKKENAVLLSALFDFNEKEIAFLLGTKPETKKVQKIREEAAELRRDIAKRKLAERRGVMAQFSAPAGKERHAVKKKPESAKREAKPEAKKAKRAGKKHAKKKPVHAEKGKQTKLI